MTTEDDEGWERVWAVVEELTEECPDDLIMIGGVAVYMHTVAYRGRDLVPETTHDADMAVALASLGDLSNNYEVVTNRRLAKRQITIEDVEIDLYVEHNNDLRIDYGDLSKGAVSIGEIRVAHLEHLLLLKLDAYKARARSRHGEKDRRDLAKILVMLKDTEPRLVLPWITISDLSLLEGVLKSSAFSQITGGNAKTARQLRVRASRYVLALPDDLSED